MTFGRNVRGIIADREPIPPAAGQTRPKYGGPFAPWAIPAAGLATDPRSAQLVQEIYNIVPGRFNLNTRRFCPAIFFEEDANTTATIQLFNKFGNISNIPNGSTVPWNANFLFPGDTDSADTDSAACLVNASTGRCRVFITGSFNSGNGILRCSGAQEVQTGVGNTSGSPGNIFEKENGTRVLRACGIANPMMMILRSEIDAGLIPHATTLLWTLPTKFAFVPPAIKGPGFLNSPPSGRWAMGYRIVWDLTDNDIDQWANGLNATVRTGLRAIAVALRDFGAIGTDGGGTQSAKTGVIWMEHDNSAKWDQIGFSQSLTLRALHDLLEPNQAKARVLKPPVHVNGDVNNVACYPEFNYPQGHPCNPF